MKKHILTPGPSELYFTVEDHIRTALRNNLCEISHRSKDFQQIVQHTIEQLRQLLNIPAHYHIVFTASATEIWERIIENLVDSYSFHLVNGSFSSKFYEFAIQLQRQATKHQVAENEGFVLSDFTIPFGTELICLTHNETSTGVMMPLEDIYQIRKNNPDALIALDMVSSAPYPNLDFTQIDTAFFSVQKCFGLPAGLGVWIFNDRCVEKAKQIQQRGKSIGTYHTIPALLANIQKNETPETPNMLGIYLLGKVAEDMNRRTIQTIRTETDYKAAVLYQKLSNHSKFKSAVTNKTFRSQTVIVVEGKAQDLKELMEICEQEKIILGTGYGKFKDTQIRIANFPTHAKEIFDKIADILDIIR
jgi:phosphoserine aminotransferase